MKVETCCKSMKKCEAKTEIFLDQHVITQTIIMKNIRKSDLIQMMIYLNKMLQLYDMAIVVRSVCHGSNKYYP